MSAGFLAEPDRPGRARVASSSALKCGPALMRVRRSASDWRQAVSLVGQPLVDAGCARPGFTDRLVSVIETYGPYMVIAPGLALVHAHPGLDSLSGGMSAVTLPEGVSFGHAHFDPVGLIIGLTAASPAEHLSIIAEVASALEQQPDLVRESLTAHTPAALAGLLRERLPHLPLA